MNPISPTRTDRRPRRRLAVAAAALAATGLVASACGTSTGGTSTGSTSTGNSDDAKASAGFPVTVKHALGSTTIPSVPKRVATVGWGSEDVAIALGDAPVAMPKGTFGADAVTFASLSTCVARKCATVPKRPSSSVSQRDLG